VSCARTGTRADRSSDLWQRNAEEVRDLARIDSSAFRVVELWQGDVQRSADSPAGHLALATDPLEPAERD
jgi:hypothetical protein